MENGRETITLAGGCFWCLQPVFQELRGVERVEVGYSGGKVQNPSYEMVCTDTTGHAEAIQITFDPTIVSLAEILRIFFTVHDPTTLNRQGGDFGTQYRSAVFYANDDQKGAAEGHRGVRSSEALGPSVRDGALAPVRVLSRR